VPRRLAALNDKSRPADRARLRHASDHAIDTSRQRVTACSRMQERGELRFALRPPLAARPSQSEAMKQSPPCAETAPFASTRQRATARSGRRAAVESRPSQQRADTRTGAPRQLLCREAGVPPSAPAPRPFRSSDAGPARRSQPPKGQLDPSHSDSNWELGDRHGEVPGGRESPGGALSVSVWWNAAGLSRSRGGGCPSRRTRRRRRA
jgi:hypothetical protein